MITHESKPEQAARWLARYLAEQPGRMAESAEVKQAAAELGFGALSTLARARNRLGVQVHTGSAAGRPFVTWWLLPEREPLTLTDSERDEAERFLAVVARGDQAQVHELLGSLRPARLALATRGAAARRARHGHGRTARPGCGPTAPSDSRGHGKYHRSPGRWHRDLTSTSHNQQGHERNLK